MWSFFNVATSFPLVIGVVATMFQGLVLNLNIQYYISLIYVNYISLNHHPNSSKLVSFKKLAIVSSWFNLYNMGCKLHFFKNFLWLTTRS
jgi:hypothetical protein